MRLGSDPVSLFTAKVRIALDEKAIDCERFSVADIATFAMLTAASSLGARVPDRFENLHGWLARVGARPAVAKDTRGMIEFFLSH